jgi:hypothetical protein
MILSEALKKAAESTHIKRVEETLDRQFKELEPLSMFLGVAFPLTDESAEKVMEGVERGLKE